MGKTTKGQAPTASTLPRSAGHRTLKDAEVAAKHFAALYGRQVFVVKRTTGNGKEFVVIGYDDGSAVANAIPPNDTKTSEGE